MMTRFRRLLLPSAAVVATLPLVVQEAPAQAPASPANAAAVMAATQEALGGAKRIATVRSFVATGRTRQVQGDNLVPIEFEISCELPDRCVRRDEIPARESGPTTIGFNGNELIQSPVPAAPPPGRGAPPGAPSAAAQRAARLATVKQDFARLMLGMFATAPPVEPLALEYVAEAEAPQGRADVIAIRGSADLDGRLFVFRETRLPVMFTWTAPVQGKPAEHRLFFADYRSSDGLTLPFRLRRGVGADTTEETTFDRFRINVRIDPRKFEVRPCCASCPGAGWGWCSLSPRRRSRRKAPATGA